MRELIRRGWMLCPRCWVYFVSLDPFALVSNAPAVCVACYLCQNARSRSVRRQCACELNQLFSKNAAQFTSPRAAELWVDLRVMLREVEMQQSWMLGWVTTHLRASLRVQRVWRVWRMRHVLLLCNHALCSTAQWLPECDLAETPLRSVVCTGGRDGSLLSSHCFSSWQKHRFAQQSSRLELAEPLVCPGESVPTAGRSNASPCSRRAWSYQEQRFPQQSNCACSWQSYQFVL